MAGINVEDFSSFSSNLIDYSIDGVHQPTSGAIHFYLSNEDYINLRGKDYPESLWLEYREGCDITFESPEINIYNNVENWSSVYFIGDTTKYNGYINNDGLFSCSGNLILNTTYQNSGGTSNLEISNGYLNTDNIVWSTSNQDIVFGSNAQLQITSSSNGKTLIKGNEVSGTITLDVQSGVNEGDTFSIEATTNNLVITDGEWTATPSTIGNVTTYTLAKAGPSKKQRLFYTYENGSRVLRFLRSGL